MYVAAIVIAIVALSAAALIVYRVRVNGPFEATHYVWFRGLGLLCDKNGGFDFVKKQRGNRVAIRFDPREYEDIRPGDLLWVRHIALSQFAAEVLPTIRTPFGLVTGDEDWGIPSQFSESSRILEHPYLIHWFTQNFDGSDTSGRISGVPLGLDFHTISNRRKWGHWPATPAQQERQLRSIVATMTPTLERTRLVHADFHLNKYK